MISLNRAFLLILLGLVLCLLPAASADDFLEIDFSLFSAWNSGMSSEWPVGADVTNYSMWPRSWGFSYSWDTEAFESIIVFNAMYGKTNRKYLVNGEVSEYKPFNVKFWVKNWTVSFREYYRIPLPVFNEKVHILPGFQMAVGRYHDFLIGYTEYKRPATDYLYMFLKTGARIEVLIEDVRIGCEYMYPFLGALTDQVFEENRREDYFSLWASWEDRDMRVRLGYERTKFIYSFPLQNNMTDQYYSHRSMNRIFLTFGVDI